MLFVPTARILDRQRLSATPVHTASTTPKGQAPCRKPYTDASTQAPANARTNQWLLSSRGIEYQHGGDGQQPEQRQTVHPAAPQFSAAPVSAAP
jgi:hypothetical protein